MTVAIRSFADLKDGFALKQAKADLDDLRGSGGYSRAQLRLAEYATRRAAADPMLFFEIASARRGYEKWLTHCLREIDR